MATNSASSSRPETAVSLNKAAADAAGTFLTGSASLLLHGVSRDGGAAQIGSSVARAIASASADARPSDCSAQASNTACPSFWDLTGMKCRSGC